MEDRRVNPNACNTQAKDRFLNLDRYVLNNAPMVIIR
jgi:hypothetical protein